MQKVPRELRFVEPMECLEVGEANIPEGKGWSYEIKHDGYRAIAIKQNNEILLFSRNGKPLNQFLNLYEELRETPGKTFILDGEIVALDDAGRQSFSILQNIRSKRRSVTFYAFDLLHFNGRDLMEEPLRERRAFLEKTFLKLPPNLKISPVLKGTRASVLAKLREFEFEGIIAKRLDSIYEPGKRSGACQKHKTQRTDDFIIGGYIGDRAVEELLVGEQRGDGLHFVESVKNGFVPAKRREVYQAIHKLVRGEQPFVNLPEKKGPHAMDREKMREVHWVKPKLVVELAFNERTSHGHLRHSRFVRLRPDKM